MLALFWYSPTPHWMDRNRSGHPAFFLEGDTYADLAWDLVDQFVDGFLTQHLFAGKKSNIMSGAFTAMDASEIAPSMLRLQDYHEQRFSSEWAHKHQRVIWDYVERKSGQPGHLIGTIKPGEMLDWYLATIIEYSYAPHHGRLCPATPESALAYFEENTYLRWIDSKDPAAIAKLMSGDLSAYY